jgi:hypothetical protein
MNLSAISNSNPQFELVSAEHRTRGILNIDESHAGLALV